MPLRDHFHPPLSTERDWHSFHSAWATFISADLNKRLPEGYFAEPNVQFGIEFDAAPFEEPEDPSVSSKWRPPAPSAELPFSSAGDVVEIQVFSGLGGPTAVGVMELVGPQTRTGMVTEMHSSQRVRHTYAREWA